MWQFGLSALVTPVVRRVGVSALGWGRGLFYSTVAQTATFVAVDKVTDLVLQKEANEEPTIAEMALDLLLATILYRKGGKAFRAARSRASQLRQSNRAKFSEFANSMGRTPVIDVTSFSKKFASYVQTKRPQVTWAFSKATGQLHMFGRNSGRYYGSVGQKGISIPGVKKLDNIRMVLRDPKVALSAAGFTTAGLSMLAESLFFLADEIHGVDPKDVGDANSTEINDKLSFLRDPDYWLDQFGSETTPADVCVERALAWFLNPGSDGAEIVEVDDVTDLEVAKMEEATSYVEKHVNKKTGEFSAEAVAELESDDRISDLHELQCAVGLACAGTTPTTVQAKRKPTGYTYHSAFPGTGGSTSQPAEVVSTLPGLQ